MNSAIGQGYNNSSGHTANVAEFINIGKYFLHCFERRGNIQDLENAIKYFTSAFVLTPMDDSSRNLQLVDLGELHMRRFLSLRDIQDVEKAIAYYNQVDWVILQDPECKIGALSNYGVCYCHRFERFSELQDLDNAIRYTNMAISLSAFSCEGPAPLYINIANCYLRRFGRLGDIGDLQKAIDHYTEAVAHMAPHDQHAKSHYLSHLGIAYRTRFECLGNTEDIHMAIDYQTQAVRLAPEKAKAERLSSLGSSFARRFEYFGDLDDLNQAIDYRQQAVALTPPGAASKRPRLANLGSSYRVRFESTGQLQDIDTAINLQTEALTDTPDDDPHKPSTHHNLAQSYEIRSRRLGTLQDNDKAIHHHGQAINLVPDGHSMRFAYLISYGNCLRHRAANSKNLSDIDAAIRWQEQAISLLQPRHAAKVDCMNNLGNSYRSRFCLSNSAEDIDQAITCQSYAVLFTGENNSREFLRLSNLGTSYLYRFEHQHDRADIDMSIRCQAEAVALIPENHPWMSYHLGRLASAYRSLYEYSGELDSIENSLKYFKQAALLSSGAPGLLYSAARNWAKLAASNPRFDPLAAYARTMELVPQVVWLGAAVEQRYYYINSMGSISAESAAAAIVVGQYDTALEWIEAGRSIVWRQMLQLRTPFDDLSTVNPSLAEKMKRVSRELNKMSVRLNDDLDMFANELSPEQTSQRHRRLADEWDQLLAQAKGYSQFKDFLVPKKASELKQATRNGPVVVINIHESRSDAIILRSPSSVVEHVYLPNLSYQKTNAARSRLLDELNGPQVRQRGERHPVWVTHGDSRIDEHHFGDLLANLWEDVVHPVFDHLGYMQRPPTGKLPHVTWCTSGPLALLPLHAAGRYDGPKKVKVFNYVISSYTPMLGDLLNASLSHDYRPSGLLAIAQPHTKGCSPLPCTVDEVARIQHHASGLRHTVLQNDHATVSSVLDAMEQHSWIHLACHATQNTTSPITSGFHLHDGLLSLSSIVQKSMTNKGLAFLSACQTATGDEKIPGEAVHLAAGMLVAGYTSVVATLWSIKDEDAPVVAEQVYARLLKDGRMRSDEVAEALHDAVGTLREIVGDEAFDRWVPFVHLGC